MKAERARLKRLQRLERVRAIAKQTAASEAAAAESTLAQLESLAERTRSLAADYAARGEQADGAALTQIVRFAGGLREIHARTMDDAGRARDLADGKLAALGKAERRRAAVEDRASAAARVIGRTAQPPALASRRGFGTELD